MNESLSGWTPGLYPEGIGSLERNANEEMFTFLLRDSEDYVSCRLLHMPLSHSQTHFLLPLYLPS